MWRALLSGSVSFAVLSMAFASMALASPGAGSSHSAAAPNLPDGAVVRAADLRVTLGRLLGEHAFLAMQAMRTGVGGGADFAAAAEALEANTVDLEELISSLYGEDGGARFGELWRSHLGYVVDYAVGVANDDGAATETALAGLAEYEADLVTFLTAANPFLVEDQIASMLAEHVSLLTRLADVADVDYEAAYTAARETYGHMFHLGEVLAAAIARQFPDQIPGARLAASPALELRVTFDRLLGEHTLLSVEAMRGAAAGRADADAARNALAANSADLSRAISGIYGEESGEAFRELWDGHVVAYLDYIAAIQDGDEMTSDAARESVLDTSHLSSLLTASIPSLDRSAVESLVGQHVQQLIGQVDAYEAEDYSRAFSIGRDAFLHSLVISDALSIAIAQQFPDIFPPLPDSSTSGLLAETGPSAASHSGTLMAVLFMSVLIVAASVRRRTDQVDGSK